MLMSYGNRILIVVFVLLPTVRVRTWPLNALVLSEKMCTTTFTAQWQYDCR